MQYKSCTLELNRLDKSAQGVTPRQSHFAMQKHCEIRVQRNLKRQIPSSKLRRNPKPKIPEAIRRPAGAAPKEARTALSAGVSANRLEPRGQGCPRSLC